LQEAIRGLASSNGMVLVVSPVLFHQKAPLSQAFDDAIAATNVAAIFFTAFTSYSSQFRSAGLLIN
jgi:hypothetical protein